MKGENFGRMRFFGKLLFVLIIPVVMVMIAGLFYYYQQNQALHDSGGEGGGVVTLPGTHPNITFSGQIVFVSEMGGHKGLYVLDPNSREIRVLFENPGIERSIAVSHDGKQVAFGMAKGKQSRLYVMPLAGGEPRGLTRPGNFLMPTFSFSGKKLVYVEDNEGVSRILMQIDLKTGKASPFVRPRHWYSDPSLLPNGDLVCTAYLGSKDQIIVLNPKTGSEDNLTDNNYDNAKPSVSPDGKKIVFVSNRDGNPEIYMMNITGQEVHRLTLTTGVDYEDPSWSPDGKYVVFSSNKDGAGYDLYIMDEQGNVLRRLTQGNVDNFSPRWY